MRKVLLLSFTLLLFSITSQAQFKKLIKHAKEKAMDVVLGEEEQTDSGHAQQDSPQTVPASQKQSEATNQRENAEAKKQPEVKTIDFPVTGETVVAMHAVLAPVIDGDLKKMANTPQGQYAASRARDKGFEGSDEEILRQLIQPANRQVMQEISKEVEHKFHRKAKKRSGSENTNPAHGGFSTPSMYFYAMIGEFDVWMTNRYVKWQLGHSHPTMAQLFGVTAVSVTDLQKGMMYSIGSVLGFNYTLVKSLDTVNNSYGPLAVMPLFKEVYRGIDGIKYEIGGPEKFGEFNNCSVVKITVPVRPYINEAGREDNGLLSLHDILSGREDATKRNGKGHWDPSYKIIFKGYFSHDIEKYLPENIKDRIHHLQWKRGMGVGAAIVDEKGNSANFRLVNITTDNNIDKGQFQIPEDYPIMTQDEFDEELKDHFKLKNIFKRAIKKTGSGDEK